MARVKKQVAARRTTARSSSFVAGLGALVSLWPPSQPARYPHRSDLDALRSDAVKIGDDMRRVVDRRHAQLKAREE